mmetsp:Transcript_22593/g.54210  ORF Transcript_22593/g.54210 Transcript_22593/m.54210 type:complete len:200 (-) Transcript_22593:353-952(-)
MSVIMIRGSLPPPPPLTDPKSPLARPSYHPRTSKHSGTSGSSSTVELRVVLMDRPPKSDTRQPFIATTYFPLSSSVNRSLFSSHSVHLMVLPPLSTRRKSRFGIVLPALAPFLTVMLLIGWIVSAIPITSMIALGSVSSIEGGSFGWTFTILTKLYWIFGASSSWHSSKCASRLKVISYSLLQLLYCLFADLIVPPRIL